MFLLLLTLICIRNVGHSKYFLILTKMLKNNGENFYFADKSKINILVTGFSGSGKSTLINNILNSSYLETAIGKLVTKEIVSVTKDGVPLQFFDTPGFEIDPIKKEKTIKQYLSIVKIWTYYERYK